MTAKQKEIIKDNLRAYISNFGYISIEKENYGKGFYVFTSPERKDQGSYTQFCYNIDYLNCKKVDTAISRAKKILIDRAKNDGICENFGREEFIKIKGKFIDITDYSEKMNAIRTKIDRFDEWCMTYTG